MVAGRESNDLYTEMIDSEVIVPDPSLPDSKVSLICGQVNEPSGAVSSVAKAPLRLL